MQQIRICVEIRYGVLSYGCKIEHESITSCGPVSVWFAPVAAIILLLEGVAGGSTIRIPVFEPSFVNVNDDCV